MEGIEDLRQICLEVQKIFHIFAPNKRMSEQRHGK